MYKKAVHGNLVLCIGWYA